MSICPYGLSQELKIHLGFMQSSIGGGQRSHSAVAYLEPVLNRTNLDVLINTQFTRLIQSGGVGKTPEFKIAEIAQGPLGKSFLSACGINVHDD